MLQSLRNRRNRKGFTLAELLIVIAIIAVLVAIAVPLFLGQVKKAQDTAFEANKRSARGAVIAAILNDGIAFTDGQFYTVEVKKDGTMGKITQAGSAETTSYAEWQASETIIVKITVTDLEVGS